MAFDTGKEVHSGVELTLIVHRILGQGGDFLTMERRPPIAIGSWNEEKIFQQGWLTFWTRQDMR